MNKIYDSIIIGSSPVLMVEAICLANDGKSVLVLEGRDRIGGAWSTIDLPGMKTIEANCHILLDSTKGYKIMSHFLDWEMEVLKPQPQIGIFGKFFHYNSPFRYIIRTFEDIGRKFKRKEKDYSMNPLSVNWFEYLSDVLGEMWGRIYYLKEGTPEMTTKLRTKLEEAKGELRLNTKVKNLKLDKNIITVDSDQGEFKSREIVITKGVELSTIQKGKENLQVKSKIKDSIQLYLLLKDPKPREISYILLFGNKVIHRISEHNYNFDDNKKTGRLLVLQIHNKFYEGNKENLDLIVAEVMDSLEKLKVIGKASKVIEYHFKNYPSVYKTSSTIKEIEDFTQKKIRFIPVEDISKTIGYAFSKRYDFLRNEKLISKYINTFFNKKYSRFVKHVSWNLVSVFLIGSNTILNNYLISHEYGVTGLGIFNQAVSIYLILSLIGVFGIQFSVIKHSAEYKADKNNLENIVRSAIFLVVGISLLVMLITYLSIGFLAHLLQSDEVVPILHPMALGLVLYSMNKIFVGYLNGVRKMQFFAFIQSMRSILVVGFLFGSIQLNLPLKTAVLAFPFAELILFLILIIYIHRFIKPFKEININSWLRTHLNFGSKTFLFSSVSELNSRIDILMLGFVMSDRAVGVYSFGASIMRGLLSLSNIVQINFAPIITELWAKKKIGELADLMKLVKNYTYIFFIPFLIAASIAYPLAIHFEIINKEFAESLIPFYILIVGVGIYSGVDAYNGLLIRVGKPLVQGQIELKILITNVILCLIFIPLLGIAGAALATTIGFLLLTVLLNKSAKELMISGKI